MGDCVGVPSMMGVGEDGSEQAEVGRVLRPSSRCCGPVSVGGVLEDGAGRSALMTGAGGRMVWVAGALGRNATGCGGDGVGRTTRRRLCRGCARPSGKGYLRGSPPCCDGTSSEGFGSSVGGVGEGRGRFASGFGGTGPGLCRGWCAGWWLRARAGASRRWPGPRPGMSGVVCRVVAEDKDGSFGRVWEHRAGIVSEVGCRVVAEGEGQTFATVVRDQGRASVGGPVDDGGGCQRCCFRVAADGSEEARNWLESGVDFGGWSDSLVVHAF